MKEPELTVSTYRIIDSNPTRHRQTLIEERFTEKDGPQLWAVIDPTIGYVLNKNGKWEHEPRPSERDFEFSNRTRFDSVQAAFDAYSAWKKASEDYWNQDHTFPSPA